MKIKKTAGMRAFECMAYVILGVFSIACVLPFILIITSSFSSAESIARYGYQLFPNEWSLEGYRLILQGYKDLIRAYGVTIYTTVIGTTACVLMNAVTGYVLSRVEFRYRNTLSFLFYIGGFITGGLIPTYFLWAGVFNMRGTLTVLWLPGLVSSFYIILMRTFTTSNLPDSITDAAKIDGASQWIIFYKIALPVLKPALATVGLFAALGFWNSWLPSSLYSTDSSTWQLQFYLQNIINKQNALEMIAKETGLMIGEMPKESMKMAMTVVATGPIILLYPFVQKYFVSGITIGSVKG